MSDREISSFIVVLCVVACVLVAPRLLQPLANRKNCVASFGGGSAVAYVFLALLPELEMDHLVIGQRIHLIILLGFSVIFLVDQRMIAGARENAGGRFAMEVGLASIYLFLLVFTLAEQLPMHPGMAVAWVLGLALHVVQQQRNLHEALDLRQHPAARKVVVAAVAGGWLVYYVTTMPELLLDLLTAMIAGFIMYRVFGEELSAATHLHICSFLAGIVTFSVLHWAAGV